MSQVVCPYCEQPAKLTSGRTLYKNRPDLYDLVFWACFDCQAWVGCHKGGVKPFGRLANGTLRKLKMEAHAAFDPTWLAYPKSHRAQQRRKMYSWLAAKLDIPPQECHIGMFDEDTCKEVIEICNTQIER